ncbi:MAG TPA: YdcF family protein [Beijerinckiaceae bacterium]|nr:YdcF family protein [Beijerinckiaceae bacterium]
MFYLSKLVWLLMEPSTALTLAVLVGALLCRTRLALWGRRLGIAGAVGLLIGGFTPLSTLILRPLEEHFPPFQDDGIPVAGVLVLGGALQTEVAVGRAQFAVNEAAERFTILPALARRYPEARLVFVGGSGDPLGGIPPEADVVRRVIGDLIPPDRLVYERASRNTHENAVNSFVQLRPGKGERWLLVTSAWHMPRSVALFRKAGWTVVPFPVDYRSSGSGDDYRPFTSVSQGLRRLDLATKEWVGLVFARLSGQSEALLPER